MPERFSFEEPPKGELVEAEKKVEIAVEKEKDTSELGEVLDKIKEKEAEKSPETRPWIKKAGEYIKRGAEYDVGPGLKKTTWGLLKIAGWALIIGLWLSLKTIEKTAKLTKAGIEKGPKGIAEEIGKGFGKITEKIAGKGDKK